MTQFYHLLAGLTVVYLVVCLLGILFQDRLVFFPERALVTVPEQVGLSYRDVYFETADGMRLHGWFVPAAAQRAVLLFCHGNAGNISGRLESLQMFNELGLSVFIFDYRGYGQSRGRASERGTYADARAAWRHLTEDEGVAPDQIILFGRSLGGAVAIELATHVRPRALIVESTFTSAAELGARIYPWLPVRQLARIRYDSQGRVRRLRCPKLFVHSLHDETVPFSMALKLFERAARPKELLKIRGGHNDGFLVSGRKYLDGLAGFLDGLGI